MPIFFPSFVWWTPKTAARNHAMRAGDGAQWFLPLDQNNVFQNLTTKKFLPQWKIINSLSAMISSQRILLFEVFPLLWNFREHNRIRKGCLVRTVPKFNGRLTSSWRFTTIFLVRPQHRIHPFIFSLSSACPPYCFTIMVLIQTIFSCSHHDHAFLKACCQCGVIYDHKCKKEGYKGVNMETYCSFLIVPLMTGAVWNPPLCFGWLLVPLIVMKCLCNGTEEN